MRKKRRLLKNSVVVFFFCFPRKPRRQSDKMYEETIYADRQHGLFKRQVKEQLFWTSILMLTKNKKCQDLAKGPHTVREAALAAGRLRLQMDPEWEAMKAQSPARNTIRPACPGAINTSKRAETLL